MIKGLEALENLTEISIVLDKQMRAGTELNFSLKNSNDYKIIKKELKVLDFLKDIVDVEEYKEGSYCLVDLCSDNKDHICDIDKETYNLFKEVIKNE